MKARRKAAGQSGAVLNRTTERFSAEELDCSSCGDSVRATLRELPGIQAIAVNVPGREIAVTFDPTRVDPDAIRTRLNDLGLGCQ